MKKDTIIAYLKPIFAGVLLYILISAVFHPYLVSGTSMYPTFNNNDIVLCYPSFKPENLMRGDVILYKHGYITLIKRIVALPGDSVQVIDGVLYVNDERSPYNYELIEDPGILKDKINISENEIFYMGDNRNHSYDARMYGPGKFENIKGVVQKKLGQ